MDIFCHGTFSLVLDNNIFLLHWLLVAKSLFFFLSFCECIRQTNKNKDIYDVHIKVMPVTWIAYFIICFCVVVDFVFMGLLFRNVTINDKIYNLLFDIQFLSQNKRQQIIKCSIETRNSVKKKIILDYG